MNKFEVLDMSCGHCVSKITQAIHALDAGARVEIDLASHRVSVAPTEADAQQLADAISGAGRRPAATQLSPAHGAKSPRATGWHPPSSPAVPGLLTFLAAPELISIGIDSKCLDEPNQGRYISSHVS